MGAGFLSRTRTPTPSRSSMLVRGGSRKRSLQHLLPAFLTEARPTPLRFPLTDERCISQMPTTIILPSWMSAVRAWPAPWGLSPPGGIPRRSAFWPPAGRSLSQMARGANQKQIRAGPIRTTQDSPANTSVRFSWDHSHASILPTIGLWPSLRRRCMPIRRYTIPPSLPPTVGG